MASILFLGFFIGMHHTLEADHVAAVASISSDESSVRRIVKHGVVWGMGHTLTLLVFGGGAVNLQILHFDTRSTTSGDGYGGRLAIQ